MTGGGSAPAPGRPPSTAKPRCRSASRRPRSRSPGSRRNWTMTPRPPPAARQSPPLPDQIHARHGVYPQETLVDGGFVNLEDMETAPAPPRGTTVYAPVPRPKDARRDRYEPLPSDGEQVQAWRQRMGTEA